MAAGAKPWAGGILCLAALLAGCGRTAHTSKARPTFVPPPSSRSAPGLLPNSPQVAYSPSLVELSPAVRASMQGSEARRKADSLTQSANLLLQRGRGLYQANEIAKAREEFDKAVDLMLQAGAGLEGLDRQDYSRKLDELVETIHRFDLAGMGASDTQEGKFDRAPLEDILQMTFPVDPRLKSKVRDQVAATASQLPLTVNDAVLGYINYFSNRGHRTVVSGIQRSGRYRPMIQRILDEEGLPQEIIHLAQAESGFYPRAMSSMAAGGMWQFVKFRGNEYGLKQTPYTDDRMDPEKATRAAARHLHDLYSQFGDWYLALAAYNCGPMTVEKAVERTGYADFWELRSRGVLPAETTNYVPIILAMTIMEKNAAEYGLTGIQMDPPLEYDTVQITAKTSLALVSDAIDTPIPELSALNPSILKTMIPPDYPLHVPKGMGSQLMAGLEMIPAEHRDAWRIHRLGTGETLAAVGQRYGVTSASLVSVNQLQSPEANEGDRLIIPAAMRAEPVARPAARTGVKPGAKPAASGRRSTTGNRTAPSSSKTPAASPAKSAPASTKKGAKPKSQPTSKSPLVARSKQ